MSPEFKFILASGSPRRRELLTLLGLPFEVQPGQINESINVAEKPLDYVKRMAEEKSNADIHSDNSWVLSADTIVEHNGMVIGKPKDPAEAKETLKALRAKDHRVITALNFSIDGQSRSAQCQTTVSMRDYSDDEINSYIFTNGPMDKAGAYAIQDAAFHPVSNLQGCWANVMGLPLCHLHKLMRQSGLETEPGIAERCQSYLGIECPVFAEILNEA
ncbi:MAG TPA: Maf family protein [Anaerolineaceae bacterium]|nr:Maf family protein [Anaerolineaceae bacterium]